MRRERALKRLLHCCMAGRKREEHHEKRIHTGSVCPLRRPFLSLFFPHVCDCFLLRVSRVAARDSDRGREFPELSSLRDDFSKEARARAGIARQLWNRERASFLHAAIVAGIHSAQFVPRRFRLIREIECVFRIDEVVTVERSLFEETERRFD